MFVVTADGAADRLIADSNPIVTEVHIDAGGVPWHGEGSPSPGVIVELKQLNFFLAVAEDLHFGRAAERMFIAQPALSQHVRRLERELGVELFDRRGRNVRLTAAGRAFVDEARRVVEQSERAATVARRASDGITGTLRIGYYPAMAASIAPALVQTFLESNDDLTVQLSADVPSGLEEAIFRGEVDLALTTGPVTRAGLEPLVVASTPISVVVMDDHPFAQRRYIEAADLEGEALILTGRTADQRLFDSIVSACHQAGFNAQAAHMVESPELVLPAVMCGLGVGVVPSSSFNGFGQGRAVAVPIAGMAPIEVVLVRRIDRTDPSVMLFWDSAMEHIDHTLSIGVTGSAFAGAEGEQAFAIAAPVGAMQPADAVAGSNGHSAPPADSPPADDGASALGS